MDCWSESQLHSGTRNSDDSTGTAAGKAAHEVGAHLLIFYLFQTAAYDMLQILSEAFVKSGQIFPDDASKIIAVERLKKLVMAASVAAFKSFKKHITPQLKLMAATFRLNVRIPPVELAAYTAEFFGVAVEKYYYSIVTIVCKCTT